MGTPAPSTGLRQEGVTEGPARRLASPGPRGKTALKVIQTTQEGKPCHCPRISDEWRANCGLPRVRGTGERHLWPPIPLTAQAGAKRPRHTGRPTKAVRVHTRPQARPAVSLGPETSQGSAPPPTTVLACAAHPQAFPQTTSTSAPAPGPHVTCPQATLGPSPLQL